jgi:serine/alanine adding enzyme
MDITRKLDEHEWREFVDNNPMGNIFHTPEMFEVFCQADRYRPSLWAALGQDGHPLAIMLPVQISVVDGPLSSLTNRAVVYGSVLCQPNDQGEAALALLLHAYRRGMDDRLLFTELRNVSDMGRLQSILEANKFHFIDHLNYRLNLRRPPDQIWDELKGQARTKIRKALRDGVEIDEVTSPDKLLVAYEILRQVYHRVRVPLGPLSLFEAAFKILHPKNMIKITLARKANTYIGVSVNLFYKDLIFDWYAGRLEKEYSALGINELLKWHIIEWGAQNGYSLFDFGGAGNPKIDYGPRNFKSKFNGTLVNYGRNVLVHAPLRLKLSSIAYELYRRRL